jgi:hypothetical protein
MKLLRPILIAIALVLSFLCFTARLETWEAVSSAQKVNFVLIGPLWGAVAFLSLCRHRRTAFVVGLLVWLLSASCLSSWNAALLAARSSARPSVCVNNLKQIALALSQYEDRYGSLPPAYIPDTQGKPMHSWRVLILPFLECESLYKQYDFNEPWDGPNNRKLHDTMPPEYSCPSDTHRKQGMTSYVAVTGEGTVWPGSRPMKSSDIRDGPDKTILVVEMANSGINWMEPKDLSFVDMDFHVYGKPGNSISSNHVNGANAAFADFAVRSLRQDADPTTIRALLTIDGGEEVSPEAVSR